jgi:hypothetical protein
VAGCDATARFFVSVEIDFSNSQAKAGATPTVRSMAAMIRRVILHSLWKVDLLAYWQIILAVLLHLSLAPCEI